MPLIETKGAASSQGFGEFAKVGGPPVYIEDVMSVWLYTGNGSTQTINNGIDLAGKGGLVWIKGRSGATDHALYDTARNATKDLVSNSTAAETTQSTGLTSFSSTGFSLGALAKLNTNAATYASWTFRKQPKFFDVVTYTGTGANRTVAHNLGSVPGCIITKRTDTTGNWITYHRSLGNTDFVNLNTTAAASADSGAWNNTTPTSTEFSLGTGNTNVNGGTYVAYLFAHDAGGFGLTGTDNVISCGSVSHTNGNNTTVNLGWEPQFIIARRSDTAANWEMYDTMRGWVAPSGSSVNLKANSSAAEASGNGYFVNSTGFQLNSAFSTGTYIYIAIRRGPMKTPTTGTSVFAPETHTSPGTSVTSTITTGFPVDLNMIGVRNTGSYNKMWTTDRLRVSNNTGTSNSLITATTSAETLYNTLTTFNFASNTGYTINDTNGSWNGTTTSQTVVSWNFRRAPGFFDVVCYTGDGTSTRNITHNLGVSPEMIIVFPRSQSGYGGQVLVLDGVSKNYQWSPNAGTGGLSSTSSAFVRSYTPPAYGITSTYVELPGYFNASGSNSSTVTYVTYLFASCPGVSKVGSYTGNGSSQTINCGFTGGARFVLIKRTDSTGNWYVWDSARGIVAGNDPYLLLNSITSEVTTDDTIDTYSTGFIVNQVAATNVNVTSATYIFLAIA